MYGAAVILQRAVGSGFGPNVKHTTMSPDTINRTRDPVLMLEYQVKLKCLPRLHHHPIQCTVVLFARVEDLQLIRWSDDGVR